MLYLKCTKCWRWKTKDLFWKENGKPFWVRPECKKCHNKNNKIDAEYRRQYYITNKEKIKQKNASYYMEHKNVHLKYMKEYTEKNRDAILEQRRKRRKNNSEQLNKKHKEYVRATSEMLGFNIDSFHKRASQYANRHLLMPSICPICWDGAKVQLHHPSYSSYDDWCVVVFCCQKCHSKIHRWDIKCPVPQNLLLLNK